MLRVKSRNTNHLLKCLIQIGFIIRSLSSSIFIRLNKLITLFVNSFFANYYQHYIYGIAFFATIFFGYAFSIFKPKKYAAGLIIFKRMYLYTF